MKKLGKVLVTGAGGFIGSHLVDRLIAQGIGVKAFVTYRSTGSLGWLDELPKEKLAEIEVFRGDVRDPHGVEAAMRGCTSVCHLAALIGIPYSYHSPDSYVETNVRGTLNVLQAARKLELEKVISTSTSEVYGTAQFVPITEEHPLVGQSPYSATKIGADQLALSFHRSFGTPVTIVRPFNTFGPRQSERAVIPTIIAQIVSGQTNLRLGSGTPTRDFCFVSDTADGFVAALRSDSRGEVFNLATGWEISVADTAATIANLTGKKISVTTEDTRLRPKESEVERLCGDNSKAKKLLSWAPKFADKGGFEAGLRETIQWFTERSKHHRLRANEYSV